MDTDNASVTIHPQYEKNFMTVAQFATNRCGDTKHGLIHSSLTKLFTNASKHRPTNSDRYMTRLFTTFLSRGPNQNEGMQQTMSVRFSAENRDVTHLIPVHPLDPHRKLSDTFRFNARGTTRDRCDTPNSRAEHIQKVIDRSHTSLQCR